MENEAIRQRAEFLVLETLVVSITRYLAQGDASFAQALGHLRNQGIARLEALAVSKVGPELSDHLSAELTEAWERLMQRVLQPKP